MIFCFGEILLRYSPSLQGQWLKQSSMPVYLGGSELNVANALAAWNIPVRYGTAMPDNYLSKEICDYLVSKQIDITSIHFSGNRIGSYTLPQGTDLKNAGVIYDRAYSSFSQLQPGMIDWEVALKGCNHFHFSAISPALSKSVAAVCKEGLEAASAKGLRISVDLNYRPQLWQDGRSPLEVMPDLVQHCHLIMGNIWAAASMLGIEMDNQPKEILQKENYIQQAIKTADQLRRHFVNCAMVANTFRFSLGETIHYYAHLSHMEGEFTSKEFKTEKAIDKVGSGDCFMAGLLYGIQKGMTAQDMITFSAAAAFGKLFEIGDATQQTVQQIKDRCQ